MRGINRQAPVAAAACMALLLGSGFGTLSARQAAAPAQAPVATPAPAPPAAPACGGRSSNPRTACPDDVAKMMAALPSTAPAKPARPRKVLVLARTAGWVHSSIPLAAKTVEALGAKTGAWSSTLTYEAADINPQNLAHYDAIVLDNTTGCFLDDPNDAPATAARRAALLAFVRGGKGIAAIHAASDSYHGNTCGEAVGTPTAVPGGQPLWPEWNTIMGGYFKWHWNDPQVITVKIDDPKSPLTAMFQGREFEIRDETYTYNDESFSRANLHVLTSVNYDKMSAEDKQKERNPRADRDYALSWIRAEGKGRLFYEAHGHGERVYAMTPMLEHLVAGIQYAIGDLKADARPQKK